MPQSNPLTAVARRDPLTGALSRELLESAAFTLLSESRDAGQPCALLVLDLDHFKSINDAYGHTRGDQALAHFTTELRATLRDGDMVFRFGGDEFVVLLRRAGAAQAGTFAERFLRTLRRHPAPGDPPLQLSASVGVAVFPEDALTPGALFDTADQRHFEAKRAGRARVVAASAPEASAGAALDAGRVLERETELVQLHAFLERLGQVPSAVLEVAGARGSGRSRFLQEARRSARLRGYVAVSLKGSRPLRARTFGALLEAEGVPREIPGPFEGVRAAAAAWEDYVERGGHSGLLFFIDNLPQLDPGSLRFLQQLASAAPVDRLAFIVSTEARGQAKGLEAGEVETLELQPLTRGGVHLWIRNNIHSEAPAAFTEWLHRETHGLPRLLRKALSGLVAEGLVRRGSGDWRVSALVREPLSHWLPSPLHVSYSLPELEPDLVGRWEEIRSLKSLLRDHPLVTVSGLGGIGKTRLALQAAAELGEELPHRAAFVPLASVETGSLVPEAILQALGQAPSAGRDSRRRTFDYLRERSMVLVLDNMEHLPSASAFVADLLREAPSLRLLVTSRERLGLPSEVVLSLVGLAAEECREGDAISPAAQLFLSCARRHDPSLEYRGETRAVVDRICARVQGMPLALELAAASVSLYSLPEIDAQIERNLDLLADGASPHPDRHRSVQAVCTSLWGQFSEAEQQSLERLSIFRGGFTRDAARALASASPFFLDALTLKGVLSRRAEGRYGIHELLRQFAYSELRTREGARADALERHSRYYLAQVSDQHEALFSPELDPALAALMDEIDNIRAAWSHATDTGSFSLLSAAGPALARFYRISGLLREGEDVFRQALERVLALSPEELERCEVARRLRAELALEHAQALRLIGHLEEALHRVEEAFRWAEEAGLPDVATKARLLRGQTLGIQGHHEEAFAELERTAEEARERDLPWEEGDSFTGRGIIAARRGRFDEAGDFFRRAEEIYRIHGALRGLASVTQNLTMLYGMQGRLEEARSYAEAALEYQRVNGKSAVVAMSLNNLGILCEMGADYHRARENYEEGLRTAREFGDINAESTVLDNLGGLWDLLGDYDRAEASCFHTIRLCERSGEKRLAASALCTLGLVYYHQGNFEAGMERIEECRELLGDGGDRANHVQALITLGHLKAAAGELAAAREAYAQAVSDCPPGGPGGQRSEALTGLARVALAEGEVEQAAAHCREALGDDPVAAILGAREPLRILLTSAICFAEAGAPEQAAEIRVLGRRLLLERADRLPNEEIRRGYLENIEVHRALLR
ncbi:MAG: diguanylate cyclase [Armatimonadota bacterium]